MKDPQIQSKYNVEFNIDILSLSARHEIYRPHQIPKCGKIKNHFSRISISGKEELKMG
jgi:hypothetical protein